MKRHELLSHLKANGCHLDREGGRHSIYENPQTQDKAPVPRHAEVDNRLAAKICMQLKIPPIR